MIMNSTACINQISINLPCRAIDFGAKHIFAVMRGEERKKLFTASENVCCAPFSCEGDEAKNRCENSTSPISLWVNVERSVVDDWAAIGVWIAVDLWPCFACFFLFSLMNCIDLGGKTILANRLDCDIRGQYRCQYNSCTATNQL